MQLQLTLYFSSEKVSNTSIWWISSEAGKIFEALKIGTCFRASMVK